MAFFIASSPHLRSKRSTADVMRWVLACALPGLIAQTYFFGYGTLIQLLLAISVQSQHCAITARWLPHGYSRSLSRHGGSS